MSTIATLTEAALDILAAWGRACSPEVMTALKDAIRLGGYPGVLVTTGDRLPDVHIVMRNPHDGGVTVVARVLIEAPAGETLQ